MFPDTVSSRCGEATGHSGYRLLNSLRSSSFNSQQRREPPMLSLPFYKNHHGLALPDLHHCGQFLVKFSSQKGMEIIDPVLTTQQRPSTVSVPTACLHCLSTIQRLTNNRLLAVLLQNGREPSYWPLDTNPNAGEMQQRRSLDSNGRGKSITGATEHGANLMNNSILLTQN